MLQGMKIYEACRVGGFRNFRGVHNEVGWESCPMRPPIRPNLSEGANFKTLNFVSIIAP